MLAGWGGGGGSVPNPNQLVVLAIPSYALPPATGSGTFLTIKNFSGQIATLTPDLTDTIDGVTGPQTTFGGSVYDNLVSLTVVDYAMGQWVLV
jgi:hypothetical protein